MSSLLDMVRDAIDDRVVKRTASELGTSPDLAQNAIETALPLLVGALGRNAAEPQGAQSLFNALHKDHGSSQPTDVLSSVLGGGGLGDGMKILGHIFGGRQQRAEQGVSQMSGLDGATAAKLMAMLAPVIMSVLANRSRQQNMGPSGLSGLLGGEKRRIEEHSGAGGLMNAVLDRDGDGDVDFADIAQNVSMLGSLFGRR